MEESSALPLAERLCSTGRRTRGLRAATPGLPGCPSVSASAGASASNDSRCTQVYAAQPGGRLSAASSRADSVPEAPLTFPAKAGRPGAVQCGSSLACLGCSQLKRGGGGAGALALASPPVAGKIKCNEKLNGRSASFRAGQWRSSQRSACVLLLPAACGGPGPAVSRA